MRNGFILIESKIICNVLIDIEFLFFELHACVELMHKYTNEILKYFRNGSYLTEAELVKSASRKNYTKWYDDLKEIRNLLIHESAPYLAIDSSIEKFSVILITKDYCEQLDDANCILSGQIDLIIDEFISFRSNLQKMIIAIITGNNVELKFDSYKRYIVRRIFGIKFSGSIRLGKIFYSFDNYIDAEIYIDSLKKNDKKVIQYAIIDYGEIKSNGRYGTKGRLVCVS